MLLRYHGVGGKEGAEVLLGSFADPLREDFGLVRGRNLFLPLRVLRRLLGHPLIRRLLPRSARSHARIRCRMQEKGDAGKARWLEGIRADRQTASALPWQHEVSRIRPQ